MSRWSNSFWKRSKTVRLFQKRRRRPQTALADLLNRFPSFALPPGIRSSYRRSRNRRGARPFSAAFSSTTSNTSNHTTAIIQKQIIQPRLYSGDHTQANGRNAVPGKMSANRLPIEPSDGVNNVYRCRPLLANGKWIQRTDRMYSKYGESTAVYSVYRSMFVDRPTTVCRR